MSTQPTERYDAIVVGAGQAGKPLSLDLAKAGWKTALVEREYIGGTCVNVGCTPTKTMVASARVAYLARRAADYGVDTGMVTVDVAEVRRRKQVVVDSFRDGGQRRVEKTEGVDLLMGAARFFDAHTLEVRLDDGAVLGLEGGEIMSMLEIAMMGKVPYTSLRDGILAHPTLAEALNNLFLAMDT
jgi:pyruvate/2-oxoglutarate dehydrogenase complex dihydrolipoamide dehydrogenase (E3) component